MGKTTLWQHGIELATAAHYRVLSASPSEAEAELSFAALGDLLEPALDEVLAALPTPQRRGLAIALLREEVDGPPPDRHAVALAFLEALRTLSLRGPAADCRRRRSVARRALRFHARLRNPAAAPGTCCHPVWAAERQRTLLARARSGDPGGSCPAARGWTAERRSGSPTAERPSGPRTCPARGCAGSTSSPAAIRSLPSSSVARFSAGPSGSRRANRCRCRWRRWSTTGWPRSQSRCALRSWLRHSSRIRPRSSSDA